MSADPALPQSLTVEARAHGWRVDHYLSRVFPNHSRGLFQRAIDQHTVLVNGLPVKASRRLRVNEAQRDGSQLFVQPPKPQFAQVTYDSPPVRRVYDLRCADDETALHPWPLAQATQLVERLRDAAAERLRRAAPTLAAAVERTLIGRKANGADSAPAQRRIRIGRAWALDDDCPARAGASPFPLPNSRSRDAASSRIPSTSRCASGDSASSRSTSTSPASSSSFNA